MSATRTGQSIKNIRADLCLSLVILFLRFFSRKIFIENIGIEVLGLNTTITNILGLLNLSELGIGSAVSYFLYTPLSQSDHKTVNEIVSLQGWLYRRVAYIILAGGAITMSLFPWIFSKTGLPSWYAYGSFGVLLTGAVLGYLINYGQIILRADQRAYKVIYNTKGYQILAVIVQIIGIKFLHYGYVFWLAVELAVALVCCLSLKRTVRRSYPWFHPDLSEGKRLLRKYCGITRKTKQLFFHKLSYYITSQATTLIIYGILSLTTVAVYGNYLVIITNISLLFNVIYEGMRAGIGNMVAEKKSGQIQTFFKEYITVRYWLVAIVCFCLFQLIPPLISLWFGSGNLIDRISFYILILSTFLSLANGFEIFLSAYGLFHDVFSPVIEGILNLSFSIVLGYYWGLPGILLGRVAGLLFMISWKPYFLYSHGFRLSIKGYIRLIARLLLLIALSAGICQIMAKLFIKPCQSMAELAYNSVLSLAYSTPVFFIMFMLFCKEFRNAADRFLVIIRHKV